MTGVARSPTSHLEQTPRLDPNNIAHVAQAQAQTLFAKPSFSMSPILGVSGPRTGAHGRPRFSIRCWSLGAPSPSVGLAPKPPTCAVSNLDDAQEVLQLRRTPAGIAVMSETTTQ